MLYYIYLLLNSTWRKRFSFYNEEVIKKNSQLNPPNSSLFMFGEGGGDQTGFKRDN